MTRTNMTGRTTTRAIPHIVKPAAMAALLLASLALSGCYVTYGPSVLHGFSSGKHGHKGFHGGAKHGHKQYGYRKGRRHG